MRRPFVIPLLAATGLVATSVALGLAPAHAEGVGAGRALAEVQPRTEPAQYTIMGDSHVMLMMNDLFPGAHANGNEGTLIKGRFHVYAINGIKLRQVVHGRGIVQAGVSVVGTTNVNKWRKAISKGPDTIVVNLGTNDGGPRAGDIDRFMRLAGKDRRVFWVAPYYTSCPVCRSIHDFELKAAAKRHANLKLIKVGDLGLTLGSDGLHAYGLANSQALWDRISETIMVPPVPRPIP